AAGIAGTGDKPRAWAAGPCREHDLGQALFHLWRMGLPDPGEQKVLPDGEADIAIAQLARDFGKAAHLRARELANGQGDAGPRLAELLLGMIADVRLAMLAVGRGDLLLVKPRQLGSEPGLHLAHKLVEAPSIEQVFEAGFFPVGTVAVDDEHTHDGVGHRHGVLRLDIDAAEFGEVLVPGDAADAKSNPDTI